MHLLDQHARAQAARERADALKDAARPVRAARRTEPDDGGLRPALAVRRTLRAAPPALPRRGFA